MRPFLLRSLAVLVLIVIMSGLLLDLSTIETDAPANFDKLVHALMFAVVFACLTVILPAFTAPALAILTVGLGGATELIQGVVGRDPSWGDFAADCVGVAVALAIAYVVRAWPLRQWRMPF